MAEIVFSGDPGEWVGRAFDWVQVHLTGRMALLQAVLAVALMLFAYVTCRALGLRRRGEAAPATGWRADALTAALLDELRHCAWAGISGLLLLFADAAARHFHLPHQVLSIATAAGRAASHSSRRGICARTTSATTPS